MIYIGIELTKLHEVGLRGTVQEIYEKVNTNPDYTMPSLKGELCVVIAPHLQTFNKDLYVQDEGFSDEMSMSTSAEKGDRTGEMKDFVKEGYNVNAGELVRSLMKTMDVSHNELVEIVSVILKIPYNKAAKIVKFSKSLEKVVDINQMFKGAEKVMNK